MGVLTLSAYPGVVNGCYDNAIVIDNVEITGFADFLD